MSVFRELQAGLAPLFRRDRQRAWFVIPALMLLLALFWQQTVHAERTPQAAVTTVGLAVLLLGALPLLVARMAGMSASELGFTRGDSAFGWRVTLLSVPVVVLVAWFAALDPRFAAVYPWPGGLIGASGAAFATWALIYALYYAAYESFFRGVLLASVVPYAGVAAGIWLQTVASFLFHLGKPFPELVASLPAGLLFGVIMVRSRSLLWPILIHVLLGVLTDLFIVMRA